MSTISTSPVKFRDGQYYNGLPETSEISVLDGKPFILQTRYYCEKISLPCDTCGQSTKYTLSVNANWPTIQHFCTNCAPTTSFTKAADFRP